MKLSAQSGPAEMYSSIVDEVDRLQGPFILKMFPDCRAGDNCPAQRQSWMGDIRKVRVFMEPTSGRVSMALYCLGDFVPGDYEIAPGSWKR